MADKNYTVAFNALMDVSQIKNATKQINDAMQGISMPKNLETGITKALGNLDKSITQFEQKAAKGISNSADAGALLKNAKLILKQYDDLQTVIKQTGNLSERQLKKLFPEEVTKNISSANAALKTYEANIKKVDKSLSEQNRLYNQKVNQIDKLKQDIDSLSKLKVIDDKQYRDFGKDLVNARGNVEKLNQEIKDQQKIIDEGRAKNGKAPSGSVKKLKELEANLASTQTTITKLETTLNESIGFNAKANEAKKLQDNLVSAEAALNNIKNTITNLETQKNSSIFNELVKALDQIEGIDVSNIKNLDDVFNVIKGLETSQLEKLTTDLTNFNKVADQAGAPVESFEAKVEEASQSLADFDNKAKEVDALKQRLTYFFGLANGINLLKRTINSAFNAIKELDKAMTQTAVVTDFTVSDMWDRLPEYTERANALGVSILSAYEAATLYYQQGLKTNEVVEVSNETLKMARIANLEAAEATDRMTAALRGFNMEINEASAQRVSDVYSELAAITASDVDEISTAMTKTASIAHSANMEFETTAAFLSQIIETTRESAETAGTAMKTVIARFQELKKSPDEIGEVDGEIVDANKIEGALRTVGVALRDTTGQFRALDDVFLELAEKWDGLDTNTQRYIATIAAGSRQQSRFIAMMQNYDRTIQLVNAANGSAGASQRQFEKTLDSMQSKLERLKNAWDSYTMGIANNRFIKGGIDLLTTFLNVINKLTQGTGSLTSSFLKLGTAIIGLKAGGKIIDSYFKIMKTGRGPVESIGAAFKQVAKDSSKVFKKDFWTYVNPNKGLLNNIQHLRTEVSLVGIEGRDNRRQLIRSMKELQNATGASTQQMALFNNLVRSGIDTQTAAVVLTDKDTASKIGNAVATGALDDAERKENLTKELNNKVQQEGLLIRIRDNLIKGAGIVLNKLSAKSTIAKSLADKFETLGLKSKNLQLLASLGLYAAIIIAVGALAAGIYWLYKAYEKNTMAYKMKEAAEATEAAKQAAEDCKSAYDDLLSDKNDYDSLQDKLKELTIGTQEWRQALIDSNSEVLNLLQTYPELAEYLSKGEFGQLIIDDAGWDDIIKRQEEAVIASMGAITSSQIKELELATQKADQDVNKKLIIYTSDGEETDIATKEKLADLLNSSTSWNEVEDGLEGIAEKSIWTVDELKEAALAMQKYNNTLDQNKLKAENLAKGFLTSSMSEVFKLSTGEYTDQVLDLFSRRMANEDYGENALKTSDIWTRGGSEWEHNDIFKNLVEDQRIEKEMTGNDKHDLQVLYASLYGIKVDEIADGIKNSKEKLAKEIAKIANDRNLAKAMDKFGEKFVNLDKRVQKQLAFAASGGASYRDNGDFNRIDEDPEEYAANLNEKTKEAIIDAYGSIKNYVEQYNEAIDNGVKEFEEARESLNKLNFSDADDFGKGKLDAGAIKGLASNFEEMAYRVGPTAAEQLYTIINDQLDSLGEEDASKFATALNSIDWTKTESIETLSDNLQYMEVTIEDVEDLEKSIITLGKATKTVDLERLTEQLKSIEDLRADINERGRTERKFSTDQMRQLVASGIDMENFTRTGAEEWTYIGSSMQDLIIALNNNTQALLGETGEILQERADKSQVWLDNVNEKNASGISNIQLITGLIRGDYGITGNTVPSKGDFVRTFDISYIKDLLDTFQVDYGDDINEYSAATLIDLLEGAYNQFYGTGGVIANQNVQASNDFNQNTKEWDYYTQDQTASLQEFDKMNTEDVEAYAKAMMALARNSSVAEDTLDEFNKITKNGTENLNEETLALLTNAIATKKAEQNLSKASSKITEITDDYENLAEEISDEDIANIAEALGFEDTSAEENLSFVRDNLDLINAAMHGDIESFNQLRDLLAEGLSTEFGISLVDGVIDLTSTEDNLNEVSKGAQAVMNQLITLGSYEVVTVTAKDHMYAQVPIVDKATHLIKGFEKQELTAGQSYQVLKPTGAPPIKNATNNTAGTWSPKSGGSGGGGGKTEKWENPYDWLYNLTEKINDNLRERERLEKRYATLTKNNIVNFEKTIEYYKERLDSLKEEQTLQEEMFSKRQQEMRDFLKDNSKLSQYGLYNWEAGTIEINWDLIDSVKDTDKGEEIEKYIGKLEELRDSMDEAYDKLLDIRDITEDIRREQLDNYLSFEDRVANALQQVDQNEIDELQKIHDSVDKANDSLVNAIEKNINKMRQDRQNAETEESITKKERRLAYLRQDTTGANALEIKKLEKELTKDKQEYGDTLIDQSINALKEQNDHAAEQREQQITLMQNQLTANEKNGVYVSKAYNLINEALNDGRFSEDDQLYDVLYQGESWYALSYTKLQDTFRQAVLELNNAGTGLKQIDTRTGLTKVPESDADISSRMKTTVGSIGNFSDYSDFINTLESENIIRNKKIDNNSELEKYGRWSSADDYLMKNYDLSALIFSLFASGRGTSDDLVRKLVQLRNKKIDTTGSNASKETAEQLHNRWSSNQTTVKQPQEGPGSEEASSFTMDDTTRKRVVTAICNNISKSGWGSYLTTDALTPKLTEVFGKEEAEKIIADSKAYYNSGGNTKYIDDSFWNNGYNLSDYYYEAMRKKILGYKTGGLADFTGPAWLDGTKAKPEIVLDAQDSANFIQLRDILRGRHIGNDGSIVGDTYYDIDVNVDSIDNDYGVDQAVERVKADIFSAASYRNTSVPLSRR